MKSFNLLLDALRKGSELANVEAWKTTGVALAILISLFSILSEVAVLQGWLAGPVSADLIQQLSAAIVAVVGVALAYLQVATSKKIGVGGKKGPTPADPEPPGAS